MKGKFQSGGIVSGGDTSNGAMRIIGGEHYFNYEQFSSLGLFIGKTEKQIVKEWERMTECEIILKDDSLERFIFKN